MIFGLLPTWTRINPEYLVREFLRTVHHLRDGSASNSAQLLGNIACLACEEAQSIWILPTFRYPPYSS
jgi:hypothetical protein